MSALIPSEAMLMTLRSSATRGRIVNASVDGARGEGAGGSFAETVCSSIDISLLTMGVSKSSVFSSSIIRALMRLLTGGLMGGLGMSMVLSMAITFANDGWNSRHLWGLK